MMSDMDPVTTGRLGKTIMRIGIAAIVIGLVGGILIAVSPVEANGVQQRQNVLFGLACCLGPGLLTGLPSVIVGRMMRASARKDDIGSMYRGWD